MKDTIHRIHILQIGEWNPRLNQSGNFLDTHKLPENCTVSLLINEITEYLPEIIFLDGSMPWEQLTLWIQQISKILFVQNTVPPLLIGYDSLLPADFIQLSSRPAIYQIRKSVSSEFLWDKMKKMTAIQKICTSDEDYFGEICLAQKIYQYWAVGKLAKDLKKWIKKIYSRDDH